MTTFNPLSATRQIQESYINFYKTNFALGNEKLSGQLDKLAKNNRLWREPFVSITQKYVMGKTLEELKSEIDTTDDVINSIPISNLFKHQENAIRNIMKNKRHTIISSGTGSGKTETFLIPILNECIKSKTDGIKAILIYPMNALANDQVDRLRDILFKLNKNNMQKKVITFGIYTGSTPNQLLEYDGEISESLLNLFYRCPSCNKTSLMCNKDGELNCRYEPEIKIKFQLLSRDEFRENPPDILITNYAMLERILIRPEDKPLFNKNTVKFLVVDEIHSYGGARGIDVALLIRRLKHRLSINRIENDDIICIGTSATMSRIDDEKIRKEKIIEFSSKLLGVEFTNNDIIEGMKKEWEFKKSIPLNYQKINVPESLDSLTDEEFINLCKQISNKDIHLAESDKKGEFLGNMLCENLFFQEIIKNTSEPKSISELRSDISRNKTLSEQLRNLDKKTIDEMIWSYLKTGTLANASGQKKKEPLLKIGVHNFFRTLPKIFMCSNPKCKEIYFTQKDRCKKCEKIVEELAVCRNCSEEFFVSQVHSEEISREASIKTNKSRLLDKLIEAKEKNKKTKQFNDVLEKYKNKPITRYSITESNESPNELWCKIIEPDGFQFEKHNDKTYLKKCLDCGSFNPIAKNECAAKIGKICGSKELIYIETFPPKTYASHTSWRPRNCPICNFSYGSGWAITKFDMTSKQASTNLFNIAFDKIENHKMLIFTDSRQNASSLAKWLDFAHEDTALKQLIIKKLEKLSNEGRDMISYRELFSKELRPTINDEWYNFNMEVFDRTMDEIEKKILLIIADKGRLAIERLGLIECTYAGLHDRKIFEEKWKKVLERYEFIKQPSQKISQIIKLETDTSHSMRYFVTTILNMMRRYEAIEGLEKREWNERFYAEGFDWDIQNETIPCARGTKIHNLASKKINRFLQYTKKVFDIDDTSEASLILEIVWNFIRKEGFVIRKKLEKRRKSGSLAYVVSQSKLELSIPKMIQKCEICHNCFTNVPGDNCQTVTRHKLCVGKTTNIPYPKFLESKIDDHFFILFKKNEPIRMVTKEHTGALSDEERKIIQDSFSAQNQSERNVDVIVATPTLELGVDIGDLSAIGLYKSPPSAINYNQRVGRAGRRDGISFINTFFFDSPIDEYYFRNPQELIKGNFYPPRINFKNTELLKRHYNSIILEKIALSEIGEILNMSIKEFDTNREIYVKNILDEIEKKKTMIQHTFQIIFGDIGEYDADQKIDEKILEFKIRFSKALDSFQEEKKYLKHAIDQIKGISKISMYVIVKLKELENRQKKLNGKRLSTHLFDANFLPKFAFPGEVVEIEDLDGSVYYGGRPRNIAITEFAPHCEITWKKKTYESIGLDPDKPAKKFNICGNCDKYYESKEIIGKQCPYCSKIIETSTPIRSIAPSKIFIREKSKTVTESNTYIEAKIDVYLSDLKIKKLERVIPMEKFDVEMTKYGNIKMLLTVNEIFTEFADSDESSEDRSREHLQICEKCGKFNDIQGRTLHRPINKKFINNTSRCNGEFIGASLHHEMSTNVISIKIKNKDDDEFISSNKFLITLKNAIIYAGQSIAESLEGEIEGVVKKNELLLFDNIEGGVGYVDIIFERMIEVLKRASEIIENEEQIYDETCDRGCLRCLWSYRRKRDIPFIDKQTIRPLLQQSYKLTTR